jgi:amino acid permease
VKRSIDVVSAWAVGIALGAYLIVALAGYATLGDCVPSDLLNAYR